MAVSLEYGFPLGLPPSALWVGFACFRTSRDRFQCLGGRGRRRPAWATGDLVTAVVLAFWTLRQEGGKLATWGETLSQNRRAGMGLQSLAPQLAAAGKRES